MILVYDMYNVQDKTPTEQTKVEQSTVNRQSTAIVWSVRDSSASPMRRLPIASASAVEEILELFLMSQSAASLPTKHCLYVCGERANDGSQRASC